MKIRAAANRLLRAALRAGEIANASAAPQDVIDQVRARSSVPWKGPEFVAWYDRDVPALLDEIDRLRYLVSKDARRDGGAKGTRHEDRSS